MSNFWANHSLLKTKILKNLFAISQKPNRLKTSAIPCWSCIYPREYHPPPPPPLSFTSFSSSLNHTSWTGLCYVLYRILKRCIAFAMIKKQNKCTVWYYISYCSRCLGELEVLRWIFYGCNFTLLPTPLANTWKVCHLKLLFPLQNIT